jgi:hypothetical protein
MAKNKKTVGSHKRIMYVLFAIITALTVALLLTLLKQDDNSTRQNNQNAVNVELGSYQYDIKGAKAVKLTDENVTSLRDFLTKSAEKDISLNCEKSYYWVATYSKDKKQVLLNYGCENPGSRMFAVQESGKWKFISPTNQFDMLGIPLCSHVNENNIDKSIAPVCYSETNDIEKTLSYQVR